MAGNTEMVRYRMVEKAPMRTSGNSPTDYQVQGVRIPTGYGKQLIPPLVREELEESTQSSPSKIKHHQKPPSIKGPPGQMEDTEESEGIMDSLYAELLEMKKKYNNLEERVVEGELWRMDIEDKINVVCKGVCRKMKRITEAMERPDLYNPTSP